jgi:hypothetical protein
VLCVLESSLKVMELFLALLERVVLILEHLRQLPGSHKFDLVQLAVLDVVLTLLDS